MKIKELFFVAAIYLVLGILFLWPGQHIFQDPNLTVGLGTDDLSLPYFHYWVVKLFSISPLSFLNASLFAPNIGAPTGSVLWVSYFERPIILLLSLVADPWRTPYLLSLTILILNGIFAYGFAKALSLGTLLSLLFGFFISFTPYTITRTMIHQSLAGTFVFTFVCMALFEVQKRPKRAALWLFVGCLSAHYYLIVLVTLLPVYFYFNRKWKIKIKVTIFTLIPMLLGLLWIKQLTPINIDHLRFDKPLYSQTLSEEDLKSRDWDVLVYSSRPGDYLTGNFANPQRDLNPIRRNYTESLIKKEPGIYIQERSAGVRWALIILTLYGCFHFSRLNTTEKKWFLVGLLMALWCFWFSLSPRSISPFGVGIGPSRWVHAVFPEMRNPNRWSPGVLFGLTLCGILICNKWLNEKKTKYTYFFLILLAFDFLPGLNFPVRDKTLLTSLPRSGCGTGMMLPYYSTDSLETYKWVATLTGTDCVVYNHHQAAQVSKLLHAQLTSVTQITQNKSILKCLPMDWVYLHPELKSILTCSDLDMKELRPGFCLNSSGFKGFKNWLECISGLKLENSP